VEIWFTFREEMAKMTVKSTFPVGKCREFVEIRFTFPASLNVVEVRVQAIL